MTLLRYTPTGTLIVMQRALERFGVGLGLRVAIGHELWWRDELDHLVAEMRARFGVDSDGGLS